MRARNSSTVFGALAICLTAEASGVAVTRGVGVGFGVGVGVGVATGCVLTLRSRCGVCALVCVNAPNVSAASRRRAMKGDVRFFLIIMLSRRRRRQHKAQPIRAGLELENISRAIEDSDRLEPNVCRPLARAYKILTATQTPRSPHGALCCRPLARANIQPCVASTIKSERKLLNPSAACPDFRR